MYGMQNDAQKLETADTGPMYVPLVQVNNVETCV